MLLFICISLVVAFLWASNVTLEKFYLLDYFTTYELRFSDAFIMFIPLIIFLNLNNQYRTKIINIPRKKLLFLMLKTLFSFVSSCFFLYLLKNNQTFLTVSIVFPTFIIFSILFSYLFFNENVNMKQLFGIFLVLLGIFIISINKK